MMAWLRRLWGDEWGVTAIEAALLFPIILVRFGGITEYSRLLLAHHMLRDILDEQVRTAVVRDLPSETVADNLDGAIQTVPGIGEPEIVVDPSESLLTLTVSGSFQMFFGELLPDSVVDYSLSASFPR